QGRGQRIASRADRAFTRAASTSAMPTCALAYSGSKAIAWVKEMHGPRAGGLGVRIQRLADIINGADVGVVQRGDRPRFLFEARQPSGVAGECGRQDFDRDIPFEPRVAPAVHLAHATDAEEGRNFIGPRRVPTPSVVCSNGPNLSAKYARQLDSSCHVAQRR